MARTIEFDVEALIGKLDVLQKVQLPYAGNRALWALKPKLRTVLQQEMLQRFRAPVRLTLNSPFMRIDGLEMEVSIKPDKVAKGNDPASYLYPVTAESGRGGGSRGVSDCRDQEAAQHGLDWQQLVFGAVSGRSWCADAQWPHDSRAIPRSLGWCVGGRSDA